MFGLPSVFRKWVPTTWCCSSSGFASSPGKQEHLSLHPSPMSRTNSNSPVWEGVPRSESNRDRRTVGRNMELNAVHYLPTRTFLLLKHKLTQTSRFSIKHKNVIFNNIVTFKMVVYSWNFERKKKNRVTRKRRNMYTWVAHKFKWIRLGSLMIYSAASLVMQVKARFKLCRFPKEPFFNTWIRSSSWKK